MNFKDPFYLRKGNVYALPVLHYNMEMAFETRRLFEYLKPSCVAVEFAETMSLQLLHGASRLPDITVISSETGKGEKLYYLVEPCDAGFEALRSSLEEQIPAFCIDLDLDDYPLHRDPFPDPYAIFKLGYQKYYELYIKTVSHLQFVQDQAREMHMARKLKELSLRYDTVLFIGGLLHVERVLASLDLTSYPIYPSVERKFISLSTPTETSLRSVLGEWGWISKHYEEARSSKEMILLDRQKLIFSLYKKAGELYKEHRHGSFPGYNLRNVMKFARNYALILDRLLPDLFQIVSAARGSVDSNYAYEVWELATDYPFWKNIDNLPEEPFTPQEIWGHSKLIRFHLREPSRKGFSDLQRRKEKKEIKFYPPGPFSICSYPPEDVAIEGFGKYLQKKGVQILTEEGARTIPFSTSLEDGIDTKETIRHFSEKKLYVKTQGKPPGGVGSLVVIFDEDSPEEGKPPMEKYPWLTTWIGEHNQESDMAFYATPMTQEVIGPGISRCEYGGFMMSYPPRRLLDVWRDSDYQGLQSKAEVLLAAAIDYSQKPLVVYVASKPPRSLLKRFAKRFGKKVVYIPIGQLSFNTLQKLRHFHVLDGHDRRNIAGEYIY